MKDEKKLQIAQITKHGRTIGLGLLYDGKLLPWQTGELDIKTYSNSQTEIAVSFKIINSELGVTTYEIPEKREGGSKTCEKNT